MRPGSSPPSAGRTPAERHADEADRRRPGSAPGSGRGSPRRRARSSARHSARVRRAPAAGSSRARGRAATALPLRQTSHRSVSDVTPRRRSACASSDSRSASSPRGSGVCRRGRVSARAPRRARRARRRDTSSAAFASPRHSSIIAPLSDLRAVGLAMPLPAMSGAEPCTGSNSDGKSPLRVRCCRRGSSPMLPSHAAREVAQDVAEQVRADDDVERVRTADELAASPRRCAASRSRRRGIPRPISASTRPTARMRTAARSTW